MRKYFILILYLAITVIGNSQVIDTTFNGLLSPIVQDSSNAPLFYIRGVFKNYLGQFDGLDVDASSVVILEENDQCYWLQVDSVISKTSSLITLRLQDSGGGGITDITASQAVIGTPIGSSQFFPYIADAPEPLQQCAQTYNWNVVSLSDSASTAFNSNRNILRVPTVGTNIGGSTIQDWLEYWYFTAPTLSLSLSPSTTVYQVGDTSRITVSGVTTNSGGSTLSNGYLRRTSPSIDTLDAFGTGTSYTFSFSFYPQKDSTAHYKQLSYSFQAKQSWVFGSESGTATSTTRTVQAVYPVLYGMSNTDLSVTGNPYTELTKLVQTEGNKTVNLTGSGYIYYAIPKTWGDFTLSQIIDHNGFDVTPSFTSYDITVGSTGLINDWTSVDYKLYKLNTTTTTSGYDYQFIR